MTAKEARILAALDEAEMSRADLEQAAGLTKDQVLHALQTLRQKGRITLLGAPRSRAARWALVR